MTFPTNRRLIEAAIFVAILAVYVSVEGVEALTSDSVVERLRRPVRVAAVALAVEFVKCFLLVAISADQ